MSRDQVIGGLIFLASIVVAIIYVWLVFFTTYDILVLKLTGSLAVIAIFGILGWIGYALATTPPPRPIEEIEKELKEELKRLEEREKEGKGDEM